MSAGVNAEDAVGADEFGPEGGVMTFREHLAELRNRIVRIVGVLLVGFFICWQFRLELFQLLSDPIAQALADNGIYQFQTIAITESVIVYLKTSVVAAIVLLSPYVFYEIWGFVAPGLLTHERRFILPLTAFTVVFFLLGAAFAYQVILPFITDWLVKLGLEGGQVGVMVTLANAFSTAFVFLLIFGFVFELPLVIFFLALFEAATAAGLARFFRYFVVLSFIVSAILTPPDPISQVLMAVPLNVLYGFGILVAWMVERTQSQQDDDPEGLREGARMEAGVSTLRLMGAGLVLLGLAGTALAGFIASLPAKPLPALLPPDTQFAMGFNPAVLLERDRALVDRLRREQPALAEVADALSTAGVAGADVRRAVLAADGQGRRLLLVRGEALGTPERLNGLRDALSEPSGGLMALAAGPDPNAGDFGVDAVDDGTVVIAVASVRAAVVGLREGEGPSVGVAEEEQRALDHARTAGPVWLWVPTRRPDADADAEGSNDEGGGDDASALAPAEGGAAAEGMTTALFGPALGREVLAATAWLSVDPQTAEARLAIELRAPDEEATDRLETRLDAARATLQPAPAAEGPDLEAALVAAVGLLLEDAATRLDAADGQRYRAAAKALDAATATGDDDASDAQPRRAAVPALDALRAHATGWGLRRDTRAVTLSTGLAPSGPAALAGAALGGDRAASGGD